MNYLDTYFSRVNFFGENATERIKNSGIVAFEKWLAQSPFRVSHLSVERGYYFSGIIETSKDKEELKIMYLYVANDIPIVVGDIMTWVQDDGTIEKWLLLQEIHKVHPTYKTFQIIKCNFQLKWIDFSDKEHGLGNLRKSWAYAVSSVDSKVKSNFRMWHSLVSPQPNKFAEVIMPCPNLSEEEDINRLMRGTTFIIEDEGWTVIECDWTSVKGIIYMSLTESKVNYEYDDRIVEVAELDRLKLPELKPVYRPGELITPTFSENTHNLWDIVLTPPTFDDSEKDPVDEKFPIEWNDSGILQAYHPTKGAVTITMQLKQLASNSSNEEINRAIIKTYEVAVVNEEQEALYIDGLDKLKMYRESIYSLLDETYSDRDFSGENIIFHIQNMPDAEGKIETTPLAIIVDDVNKTHELKPNQVLLQGNIKNKLGKVLLTAEYNNKSYTKTIEIIPLW